MQGGDKTKDTKGVFYSEGKGIPSNWVPKSLDVCNVVSSRSVTEKEHHTK